MWPATVRLSAMSVAWYHLVSSILCVRFLIWLTLYIIPVYLFWVLGLLVWLGRLWSMSDTLWCGIIDKLVWHNMSRRFLGLAIATRICWKLSWPFRVVFVDLTCFGFINIFMMKLPVDYVSFDFKSIDCSCILLAALLMVAAADLRIGIRSSRKWPSRRDMKLLVILMKSCLEEFCFQ